MYHSNVRNHRILFQHICNDLRLRLFIISLFVYHIVHTGMTADIHHTETISTICSDQHLVLTLYDTSQNRFHAKAAASLHEHSGIFCFFYMAQLQKTSADTLCDLFVIIIPGAMIKKHLLLHRIRCGQRARG